MNRQNLL